MPIYEYKCAGCGKHFEHIQKITEEPLSACPFCSGKVQKLVSNCSFHLKGTGWYVTDYGKKRVSTGKRRRVKRKAAPRAAMKLAPPKKLLLKAQYINSDLSVTV